MLVIDDDGTISLYQGDSGEITVNGLDENNAYTVYFAIQDSKRNKIGDEIQVSVNNSNTATFILTPEFTELLTVPLKKPYEVYYYGIKVCVSDSSIEDTLFISNGTYGDLNRIIVYPRKVIGTSNV
ncbi:MAG: hypothetical protein MJ230_04485 [bacterium]|nr:hypothetical protein [bacterium]